MRWMFQAVGAGLAILLMEAFAIWADEPLSRVPFVTSIVLVFAMPDAPAARPRAVIGGHLISAAIGWVSLTCLGSNEGAGAVAVGAATLLMLATGSLHPPAGLDGFLVVTQSLPAGWIVSPILVGACLLTGFAWVWRALGGILRRQAWAP